MNIIFHTNLDEPQRFVAAMNRSAKWNNTASIQAGRAVPFVGNRITFKFDKWNKEKNCSELASFDLEVVGIRWYFMGDDVFVELHIPSVYKDWSIDRWSKWYRKHVNGKDY